MNKRGGKIILQKIDAPEKQEWTGPLEAMSDALQLEKDVNDVSVYFIYTHIYICTDICIYIHNIFIYMYKYS